jgi:uncharacterized membrane protein YqjE
MQQEQDKINDRLKRLPADIRQIIEKRIELYVFDFGDKFSTKFSKIVSKSTTLIILLLGLVFLLIAVAYFLADLLDNTSLGFLVVAVVLFVFALIVYILSPELIENKVRESIAKSFMDGEAIEVNSDKIQSEHAKDDTDSEKSLKSLNKRNTTID